MKNLKLLFTVLLLLCCVGMAKAHDFEVGGIYYDILNYSNNAVEVTYRGDDYYSYDNEYTGSVVIPESVNYNGITYSVTSIGWYAFYECTGLTSITIPNSVTSIGYYAFEGCSGLTSITIPNSVTSIGYNAFSGCTEITSITIETNNTKYDSRDNCNAIIKTATNSLIAGCQNTTIPNSVTSIESGAFSGCTGLTSITIPNSVTSIESGAFSGCTGLTSITIPNSVTSIGADAFGGCSGLTSIEIPNSVTSIGDYAFFNCDGLTSITIPNSVTSIEDKAFEDCSGLTSITVETGNTKYDSRDNCNAIIETATNTLIAGCQNTTIPNSVTSIGNFAFSGCTGLTRIRIPNRVTHIGEEAFRDCSGLTSITIPNRVTSIGDSAFYKCTGLTSITIPNSVTSIGDDAFGGRSGLTSIKVESGNSVYDGRENCNAIIETATNTLIAGCQNTTIPNSVTSIGNFAFSGCTGLTRITIPNSVTSIGYGAFYSCSGLTSITIPNSVTSIRRSAFIGCTGLTSVVIGNSVTSIEDKAFEDCSGLKTVINFSNLTFSTGSSNNGYVAYYANKVYNVPDGSIEGDFIFGKPNDVNTLLYYLGNATELTLPANYKGGNYTIGANVFKGNTTITSITIPNSVTSIGEWAFQDCSGLTSITIPNSVTSIGNYAFCSCSGLTSVTSLIPADELFAIDSSVFYNVDKTTCTLYVPYGAKETYAATAGWNKFTNIVELEPGDGETTGIDEMKEQKTESKDVYYGLSGRAVENPTKGVYIINGKKVLVK